MDLATVQVAIIRSIRVNQLVGGINAIAALNVDIHIQALAKYC